MKTRDSGVSGYPFTTLRRTLYDPRPGASLPGRYCFESNAKWAKLRDDRMEPPSLVSSVYPAENVFRPVLTGGQLYIL